MDVRPPNIATALPKTCQWLIHHKQFTAWMDDGNAVDYHGFLCIKGKLKSAEDMEGWYLFSMRPLSPAELYLAINYSCTLTQPESISFPHI